MPDPTTADYFKMLGASMAKDASVQASLDRAAREAVAKLTGDLAGANASLAIASGRIIELEKIIKAAAGNGAGGTGNTGDRTGTPAKVVVVTDIKSARAAIEAGATVLQCVELKIDVGQVLDLKGAKLERLPASKDTLITLGGELANATVDANKLLAFWAHGPSAKLTNVTILPGARQWGDVSSGATLLTLAGFHAGATSHYGLYVNRGATLTIISSDKRRSELRGPCGVQAMLRTDAPSTNVNLVGVLFDNIGGGNAIARGDATWMVRDCESHGLVWGINPLDDLDGGPKIGGYAWLLEGRGNSPYQLPESPPERRVNALKLLQASIATGETFAVAARTTFMATTTPAERKAIGRENGLTNRDIELSAAERKRFIEATSKIDVIGGVFNCHWRLAPRYKGRIVGAKFTRVDVFGHDPENEFPPRELAFGGELKTGPDLEVDGCSFAATAEQIAKQVAKFPGVKITNARYGVK